MRAWRIANRAPSCAAVLLASTVFIATPACSPGRAMRADASAADRARARPRASTNLRPWLVTRSPFRVRRPFRGMFTREGRNSLRSLAATPVVDADCGGCSSLLDLRGARALTSGAP